MADNVVPFPRPARTYECVRVVQSGGRFAVFCYCPWNGDGPRDCDLFGWYDTLDEAEEAAGRASKRFGVPARPYSPPLTSAEFEQAVKEQQAERQRQEEERLRASWLDQPDDDGPDAA